MPDQDMILHFAPANGFTAGTYEKIFSFLRTAYIVKSIDKLGHNPRYPVDDNWLNLADELIEDIKQKSQKPVIGIGHSMGSVVTFLAAYKEPGLFRQVILLDPPILVGFAANLFQLTKKLGILNRSKMVTKTKKRRTKWQNLAEAEEYFRNVTLHRNFDPDCLRDYIIHTTTIDENGIKLNYDPEIESEIYRTAPHNMNSYKQALGLPGTVIIGKHTYIQSPYVLWIFARRQGFDLKRLSYGSHMFPMEYPERTAVLIKDSIEST